MNKIIIAFDGKHYSEGAVKAALHINSQQPSLLVGVFINGLTNYGQLVMQAPETPDLMAFIEEDQGKSIAEHKEKFKTACIEHNASFRMHEDKPLFIIEEMIRESRFADLLIIGGEMFYRNPKHKDEHAIHMLRNAIEKSECPVFVVPENFNPPQSVVLSYDGSASSAYAIRQFSYLLTSYTNLPVTLLYADNDPDDDVDLLPEKDLVEELIGRHFDNLTVTALQGDFKAELHNYLQTQTNTIVVLGSFSDDRGFFDKLFQRSTANPLLENMTTPLFIAHK